MKHNFGIFGPIVCLSRIQKIAFALTDTLLKYLSKHTTKRGVGLTELWVKNASGAPSDCNFLLGMLVNGDTTLLLK